MAETRCWQLEGPLCHPQVAELARRRPLTDDIHTLCLDLRQVTAVDSSALAWMLVLEEKLSARGGHLVVQSAPEALQKLARLAEVDNLIEFDGYAG